jgi:hypothetical protein
VLREEHEVMTNIELGALAHRAGFGEKIENSIRIEEFAKLKKFADLVAQREREACAKVCEEQYEYYGHDHVFAKAIRARGQE